MSNPYRDALLDLYTWADRNSSSNQRTADVMHRTRVLLTQPEPLLPTDDELNEMVPAYYRDDEFRCYREGLAAGLRWAQAAPQPEPEGPTDKELLELMPQQFRNDLATVSLMAAHSAGTGITPGLFRVSLNTGALDYARAAIAADRARRA